MTAWGRTALCGDTHSNTLHTSTAVSVFLFPYLDDTHPISHDHSHLLSLSDTDTLSNFSDPSHSADVTAVIVFVWHEHRLADDRAAAQRVAAAGFASHSSNTATKQHHYPSFSVCQHWYKQAATAHLPLPQNKQPTVCMNVSLRITQMFCNVLPG